MPTPASSHSSMHENTALALAREGVRKSLVLLKNGNGTSNTPLVPLTRNAGKILVVGAHANDISL